MDKQRVIEIAHEIARRNEEKLGHKNPHHVRLYGEPVRMIKLIDGGITDFAAAILLEAAEVCDLAREGHDSAGKYEMGGGAALCCLELKQLVKELTQ